MGRAYGIRDRNSISLQKYTGVTIAKSEEHRATSTIQRTNSKESKQKVQSKEPGIRSEELYFIGKNIAKFSIFNLTLGRLFFYD
jgi:hypothetical protein